MSTCCCLCMVLLIHLCAWWSENVNKDIIVLIYHVSLVYQLDMCVYCFSTLILENCQLWNVWMPSKMDYCVFSPSSPTQDHMVSMILIASRVRPYSSLDEYWYVDALGFFLVKSGWTLGLNSLVLRRTCASMK